MLRMVVDRFSNAGVKPVALLVLILASCAGPSGVSPPRLLVETTRDGQGWPFGESGRGPVLDLSETADDPRYGWTSKKPVELGGFDTRPPEEESLARQVRYLNSLWGPRGETIFYERIGTCCPFQMFGAPLDKGMLDIYALTWEGQERPRHLYLDSYHTGTIRIPESLTSRVRPAPIPPGAG
jgi:hypothetical protein